MQSSAKFFKNFFFSDLTASVEAAAVLPITGELHAVPLCMQHGIDLITHGAICKS